jgi:hypothetical protein
MSRITTLLLVLVLASCGTRGGDGAAALKIALVDAVNGSPYVLRENRTISLAVRSALDTEDTVITGPGDWIRFEFEDGTRLAAGQNSQIRIDTYDRSDGQLHFSSSDGTFSLELGKAMKRRDASFRMSTPFAEISASTRTKFWLEHRADSDQLEVVLLDNGALQVSNEFGGTLLTAAGQACSVGFSSAPSEVRIHDDIQSLAFATP